MQEENQIQTMIQYSRDNIKRKVYKQKVYKQREHFSS